MSPNPDPISDPKIDIFHTRFQTWSLKSMPIFRPGVGRKIMLSLLRLESQEKDFLKLTSNSHITLSFLSCSYSFEIETINMFICIHSLENHNRIQTKIGKVYTPFQA